MKEPHVLVDLENAQRALKAFFKRAQTGCTPGWGCVLIPYRHGLHVYHT